MTEQEYVKQNSEAKRPSALDSLVQKTISSYVLLFMTNKDPTLHIAAQLALVTALARLHERVLGNGDLHTAAIELGNEAGDKAYLTGRPETP